MTTILDARDYVGTGLPTSNGQRLADEVLQHNPSAWSELVIDARGCPPEYLNSALFNAFWQRLIEKRPKNAKQAKSIRWEFDHPFQQAIFDALRARFTPRQPA